MATAYAKSDIALPAKVQPLVGGVALLGEPFEGRADSFDPADFLDASRLQECWLNVWVGKKVAGSWRRASSMHRQLCMT